MRETRKYCLCKMSTKALNIVLFLHSNWRGTAPKNALFLSHLIKIKQSNSVPHVAIFKVNVACDKTATEMGVVSPQVG